MKWNQMRSAFWLAIVVHAGAFAQVPVRPGKWELTGAYKGLPFGGDAERVRTICLSAEALGPVPEKTLIEASPPPSDDASKPAPKCDYSPVRRDGPKSSWGITCTNPTMTGAGSAILISPEQVDLSEALELKMGFAARSIQHTVRARRLGDCS